MTATSAPLSREHRIYLAIWRKAYREKDSGSEPVTINASSYSVALTMRSGMYRAIRPYRTGKALDEELLKASEAFIISVCKNENSQSIHQLVLKPRLSLAEIEAELSKLGLDEADLLSPEESALSSKLSKFIQPETPPVEKPSNKFYSRES